jgi:hypothetical protein
MQSHEQRVIDERNNLDEKLSALMKFTSSELWRGMDLPDRTLMLDQAGAMTHYLIALEKRILRFK